MKIWQTPLIRAFWEMLTRIISRINLRIIMLRGVLISLLASFLFGYMYYFSTLLKPLSGTDIFGYRMIFTFPFVVLSVFMFKQKNALIHLLKTH